MIENVPMLRRHALAIALLAAVVASDARGQTPAASPTAEGAARIRTLIEGQFGKLDAMMPDGVRLLRAGTVTVEPQAAAYRIRLPALSVKLGEDAVIDVGAPEAIARPGPDDTLEVVGPMPDAISLRESGGKPVAKILLGSGQSRVTYSLRDGFALSTAVEMADLALSVAGDDTKTVTIDRLLFEDVSRPLTPGRYDDSSRLLVEGLEISDTTDDSYLGVGKIDLKGRNRNVDRASVDVLNAGFAAFAKAAESGNVDLNQLRPLLARLTDVADGADLSVELAEVSVSAPDGTSIEFGRFTYETALGGLRSGAARIDFGLAIDEVSVDGIPLPEGAVPTRLAFKVALDRIPNVAVAGTFEKLLDLAIKGSDPTDAAMGMGLELVETFARTGTEFRVEEVTVATEQYALNATGAAKVDTASPVMSTGTLVVTLTGLEQIAAMINGFETLGPKERQDLKMAMALVQSIGQQATDAAGKPARRYTFALDPAGRITLNGADVQPIVDNLMKTMK